MTSERVDAGGVSNIAQLLRSLPPPETQASGEEPQASVLAMHEGFPVKGDLDSRLCPSEGRAGFDAGCIIGAAHDRRWECADGGGAAHAVSR
jgi:hypothetical protein